MAASSIKKLKGVNTAKADLQRLVVAVEQASHRGRKRFGELRSGVIIVLHGPHGTGKTTMARQLAPLFYGLGALAENKIVQFRDPARSTGLLEDEAETAARESLGGILLIDPADWLLDARGEAGNAQSDRVARALEIVAEEQKGRLTVVVTGGPDLDRIVQHPLRNAWEKAFHFYEFRFESLSNSDLVQVFRDFLAMSGMGYSDSDDSVAGALSRRREREKESFGNAVAALSLADTGREHATLRTRKDGSGTYLSVRAEDIEK